MAGKLSGGGGVLSVLRIFKNFLSPLLAFQNKLVGEDTVHVLRLPLPAAKA